MSLLEIAGLRSGYGRVEVLHDVNLSVSDGELVTVIGANGAGKTTFLRTISGVTRGFGVVIRFGGSDISKASPARVAAAGIAHVPENRRVFGTYSVEENLQLGGYVRRRHGRELSEDIARAYERFPILKERRQQPAGTLSGGQQQMLAIAMALMARRKLLLLDEPWLGLAPIVVQQVYKEILRLKGSGTTILLVEQIANLPLRVADRGLVLQLGRVVASGSAAQLRSDPVVRASYLGA